MTSPNKRSDFLFMLFVGGPLAILLIADILFMIWSLFNHGVANLCVGIPAAVVLGWLLKVVLSKNYTPPTDWPEYGG